LTRELVRIVRGIGLRPTVGHRLVGAPAFNLCDRAPDRRAIPTMPIKPIDAQATPSPTRTA
jgi:hypothetical protein